MSAVENVLDKDLVRRFLIEQKHTYEELVIEFKARYPNLKSCSLQSFKRIDHIKNMTVFLSLNSRKTVRNSE